jgi:hypothetical protein
MKFVIAKSSGENSRNSKYQALFCKNRKTALFAVWITASASFVIPKAP